MARSYSWPKMPSWLFLRLLERDTWRFVWDHETDIGMYYDSDTGELIAFRYRSTMEGGKCSPYDAYRSPMG